MMKGILAATAIAVGLSAGQAGAVCTPHDIAGTWEFYGDISSPFFGFEQALRCTLHIAETSAMIPTTPCASVGIGGGIAAHGTVDRGAAIVGDPLNCTFNLSFDVKFGERLLPISASHATMSLSRDVVAGLVSAALGGSTFTMVKIR